MVAFVNFVSSLLFKKGERAISHYTGVLVTKPLVKFHKALELCQKHKNLQYHQTARDKWSALDSIEKKKALPVDQQVSSLSTQHSFLMQKKIDSYC